MPPRSSDSPLRSSRVCTAGSWKWTLIPTQDAAPVGPTVYYVKGVMSYTVEEQTITVPLLPQKITVYPNPNLIVKYFHQRDVFSDDPYTDIIEPSIPFTLGVMIENRGAGVAHDLSITSGQPEIIDNEKGLMIDFQIIATEVSGQNLSPGLTAQFGDIAPGEIKVGRWIMTSTLQGLFTDYSAEFEHVNDLGNERLSLIESVEIHETVHQIEALGALDDGKPDFLVNDAPDAFDYPDTIHLSDGSTVSVTVLDVATVPAPIEGALSVSLSAPGMGAGWTYLRIPDPGNGNFRLISVTRSDGLSIPLDVNFWTTDRTFIGQGHQPIRENILHLVDLNSTGTYTLNYSIRPTPDTTPPTSSISTLPDDSSELIELAWIGTDDSGVVGYDIYVSTDGGPFELWLENTTDTAALFEGVFGSSYSFISIASDAANNQEPDKSLGEATTEVTLVNQAPELELIPDLAVDEGGQIHYQVVATDPDTPLSLLRFALDSTDPSINIDPISGILRWSTTENDGTTTIEITVSVTDGAPTPLTDSQSLTITVNETNQSPTITQPEDVQIDVGETLSLQLVAQDADAPSQSLTFQLLGTPPAGMLIDQNLGLLEWTPGDEHEAQTFEVEIEVSDDQTPPGVSTQTLRIEVLKKIGLPPEFDNIPTLIWLEGGTYTYTFRASDPEGEPVTVSADISGLPGWVSVTYASDGSATLYWNTSGVNEGVYSLSLSAHTDRQQIDMTQAIQIAPRPVYDNFAGWVDTYQLVELDALDFSSSNPQGLSNLLCYALGIDPHYGISPAQPDPRPHTVLAPSPSLRFMIPSQGRDDLIYLVEYSPDLSPDSWTPIARKQGADPWTGSATLANQVASGDLIWLTVTPPASSDQTGFLRLVIDRLPTATSGFGAWPGPEGLTLSERTLSDVNSDGYSNIVAYAFGLPSAHDPLSGSGVILPHTQLTDTEVSLSMHLIAPPREDIIYYIETSPNLTHWTVIGWWSIDSSDQSQANFIVEPSGDGGYDISASWLRGSTTGNFSRLGIGYR